MYHNNRNNNRQPGNTNSGYGRGQYGARGQGNRYGSQIPGQSYNDPPLQAGYGSQMQSQSYSDSHQTNTNVTHVPGSRYGGQQPSSSYGSQQKAWQGESDTQGNYRSNMPNQSYSGQDQAYSHMSAYGGQGSSFCGEGSSSEQQEPQSALYSSFDNQAHASRFEHYGQRDSGPASSTRGIHVGGGMGGESKRKTQTQPCDDAAKRKRLADTSSDHLDGQVATQQSTDASMSDGKMMATNMKASELTSTHIYISDIPVKAVPADLLNMLRPYPHTGTRMKVTPTSDNKHTVEFAFVEFAEESDALLCLMDIQSQTFHGTHLTYKLFNASSASAELLTRFTQVKHIVPEFAEKKDQEKSKRMTKLEENAVKQQITTKSGEKSKAVSTFQSVIVGCTMPLIGLEYISEYVTSPNTYSRFLCSLCELSVDGPPVIAHVTSKKHMKKSLSLSDEVSYSGQSENPMDELVKAARDLEGKIGRQHITVVYNKKSASNSWNQSLGDGNQTEKIYIRRGSDVTETRSLSADTNIPGETTCLLNEKIKDEESAMLGYVEGPAVGEEVPQGKKKKKRLMKSQKKKLLAEAAEKMSAIEYGKIKLGVEDLALLRQFELEIFSQPPDLKHNLDWRVECPYLCGQCGYRDVTRDDVAEHQKKMKHRKAQSFHNDQLFTLRGSVRGVLNAAFVCTLCGMKRQNRKEVQVHIEYKHQTEPDAVILFDGFLCTDNYEEANRQMSKKR